MDVILLRRLPLDTGGRYAIRSITTYLITCSGVVLASATIGIGWDSIQWLIAALSVGLGFGLQEIFANFVSGLIILFERPIRVGDWVTIGDVYGEVTRIQIRATTITDLQRCELLVPNRDFISGRLLNWTLTDSRSRFDLKVGVAYGSDTDRTTRTLLEVAAAHPEILSEPAPSVVFRSFGDSCLDFELKVFLADRSILYRVIHEMNMAIDAAFRREGIEIAFPQRDLHVKSFAPGLVLPAAPPPPDAPATS